MGMVDTVQNEESSPYHTIRGQDLVWGGPPDGTHGVTELVGCERTRDLWLQSLQDEVRNGALSETNHAFLRGFATPVPGSWNGQRLECRQATCEKLLQEKAAPKTILRAECDVCKDERVSKARVADGAPPRRQPSSPGPKLFSPQMP